MAKDSKTIHGSVRHGNKVYTAGMEDELQAALSAKDLARLSDKGTISGFDGGGSKAPAETKSSEPAAETEPASEESDKNAATAEPAATPPKGKGK